MCIQGAGGGKAKGRVLLRRGGGGRGGIHKEQGARERRRGQGKFRKFVWVGAGGEEHARNKSPCTGRAAAQAFTHVEVGTQVEP